MNADLRKNKGIIRDFMRAQYSDDRLVQLLDHARAGLLAYASCCCFAAIPTADHALKGRMPDADWNILAHSSHLGAGWKLQNATKADWAFMYLSPNRDEGRRNRLIPMILAEIKRRRLMVKPEALENASVEGRR